jgi:hypothetical protein
METFLTRAITIVALTCFLVVGAAATSILGRDSVPAARYELASAAIEKPPVSNKEGKKDRLAITMALASYEPPKAQVEAQVQTQIPALAEPGLCLHLADRSGDPATG